MCDNESTEEPIEKVPSIWFVGIYLVDLARGGPEEGGWYYECGYLQTDKDFEPHQAGYLPKAFTNIKEAYQYSAEVQQHLDITINVGRRPISSVLSEGKYAAIVMEGSLPLYYPATRPHYE